MLQKILVVLVGIVMSLVGALSPAGLFASQATPDLFSLDGSLVAEETVATVRTLDGAGFAKVSVLWVEVDGRRVVDDAWGTGTVDTLRFQVGVKNAEELALAVGDRLVPLKPTDVLTVRMFTGEFAFRSMDSSDATLQLQGSVKSALVNAGISQNRVRTELSGSADAQVIEAPKGGEAEVAFVVLTTGEKLQTVSVQDGGSRLFTEEALDPASAANAPGNLLAKWVKIDGQLLREYTWGDQPVKTIEFEPADAGKGGVVLAFEESPTNVPAGSRVLVKDFVGEYLVYQVAGGLLRLRLDGFAGDMVVGAAAAAPVQTGEGAPIAAFDYSPSNPKTTDTIRFTDRSSDDTMVVLRLWRFGDDGTSVLPNPTHRFTQPGQYVVTLNVTDTDRLSSETSLVINVGNAPPVPDFDFWPKIVTTDTLVSFSDDTSDSDGTIMNWTWDFGDGVVSYDRHPTHKFATGGSATVTLTATDNLGGSASISKVVEVRNSPPLASFTYSPNEIQTLVPIQFQDTSTDRDGTIVKREWKFGDGANATGAAPVHVFQRPGLYTISLTATDNGGDSDTTSTQVFVRNRLPIANFSWTPHGAPASTPVSFTSLANDPDGTILVYEWNFGDGSSALEQNPTHFYQRSGTYTVTLTVTDNTLERNATSVLVGIANGIPRALMTVNPSPAFRGQEVTFADVSTDPDGDAIVNRTWTFDGQPVYGDQIVRRSFATSGSHAITLTVRDAAGSIGMTNMALQVANRPPELQSVSVSPDYPIVDSPVTFSAQAVDLDQQPGDPPLTYEWRFSDGPILMGQSVTRTFSLIERVTATVRAIDAEGARSNPLTAAAQISLARPDASISYSPTTPITGEPVTFVASASSLNGAITGYTWNFGDGSSASGPSVTHTYSRGGTYPVNLTVIDNRSQSRSVSMPLVVNGRPNADFDLPPGVLPRNSVVNFTDRSTDPDGDAIVSWHWDFDDASTANAQHPVHTFTLPGRHDVTLTVTDSRGASASVTKALRVENERPFARFTPPSGAVANEPATFTDQSFDPDQTPIAAWAWTFGDGQTATTQNPVHTYGASGIYSVALIVNDGELQSRRDVGSFTNVRVGADHDLPIRIRGVLPDGRPADLTSGAYTVRALVGQPGAMTQFPVAAINGTELDLTLDRGVWIRGETVRVTITAPTLFGGELAINHALADADGISRDIVFTFDVPMRLDATIEAAPGEYDTVETLPLLLPNSETTPEGYPVYRNFAEPFKGTGHVEFADGMPASSATVVLEARYVPVRLAGGIRDTFDVPDTSLLGWCRAATLTADMDGDYEWVIDARSDCLLDDLGVHPVGRWEVRAIATHPLAQSDYSDVATIYVDPTGGLLWLASAPP